MAIKKLIQHEYDSFNDNVGGPSSSPKSGQYSLSHFFDAGLNYWVPDTGADYPFTSKVTTSGSVVYVGIAVPGTAQSDAKWQAQKIDSTDANNVVITWAGGGAFNQVATDLTALTYA